MYLTDRPSRAFRSAHSVSKGCPTRREFGVVCWHKMNKDLSNYVSKVTHAMRTTNRNCRRRRSVVTYSPFSRRNIVDYLSEFFQVDCLYEHKGYKEVVCKLKYFVSPQRKPDVLHRNNPPNLAHGRPFIWVETHQKCQAVTQSNGHEMSRKPQNTRTSWFRYLFVFIRLNKNSATESTQSSDPRNLRKIFKTKEKKTLKSTVSYCTQLYYTVL